MSNVTMISFIPGIIIPSKFSIIYVSLVPSPSDLPRSAPYQMCNVTKIYKQQKSTTCVCELQFFII